MKSRSSQSGFAVIQTTVLLAVVAVVGLIAVPVYVSRAAGPRDAVLAANVRSISAALGEQALESPSPSPATAVDLDLIAAGIRGAFVRPVANPVSHSVDVLVGDDWSARTGAPAVWVTDSPSGDPRVVGDDDGLRAALAGAVVVFVDDRSGVALVYQVPNGDGDLAAPLRLTLAY